MDITRRSFVVGGMSVAALAGISSVLPGCSDDKTKSGLKIKDFESSGTGSFKTGLENTFTANVATKLCVITNSKGSEACITNLGARVVSLMVPDKSNNYKDVVLGLSSIKDYADHTGKNNVFGAAVGPVIGRISNGSFTYNGETYKLDKNSNNKHTLHSGKYGWQYQTWNIKEEKNNSVTFELVCPDMEGGFPGERKANIKYTLTDDNALQIEYHVATNKATPINIANHSYFNLEGNPNNACFNDQLQIFSETLAPVNEDVNPTGEIVPIQKNSVIDFNTKAKTIDEDKNGEDDLFQFTKGYDFAYVFNNDTKTKATLYSPVSGIFMEVISDRPVINFYDGHDLDGTIVGKNNIAYNKCSGLCLEAQGFADAVNHPNFQNSIITPDKDFKSTTIYKFSVK